MTSESSQPGAAQPAEDLRPSGPFRLGDRVQLTGPKGRMHTVTLREHGELHTHHGVLKHEAIVGQPDGSVLTNSGGHEYLALRPLLRDFVMSMPRGAAIVYPKDAAQILSLADIFPVPRLSRQASVRVRFRCTCCGRWASGANCFRSSVGRSSPRSQHRTLRPSLVQFLQTGR